MNMTFILLILTAVKTQASDTENFKGHLFPDLGYAFNALEPYIDAQTMEIHYTKHHRAYFDKFMAAAKDADLLETSIEEIFSGISKYSESIRNNGGGFYNHCIFFENLTSPKQEIPDKLKSAIIKDFGSWEAFKTSFENAAKNRFGSGWSWLSVGSDGKLFVSSTANQDNPLMDISDKRGTPILALDVWEHAYYLKYQNRRAEYVENFWNIVNWKVVMERYVKALK